MSPPKRKVRARIRVLIPNATMENEGEELPLEYELIVYEGGPTKPNLGHETTVFADHLVDCLTADLV